MGRFLGTPDLDRADLEGTAFLIRADREAKGLPALAPDDLARAARLRHFTQATDKVRRENGRRRGDRQGKGVRVGLGTPGDDATATLAHADPTAYDPARVAQARDVLARLAALLTGREARLLFGKAGGDDAPLAQADRKALSRARAKVADALAPGGALSDLGAEGYAVLAPRGGYRHGDRGGA